MQGGENTGGEELGFERIINNPNLIFGDILEGKNTDTGGGRVLPL